MPDSGVRMAIEAEAAKVDWEGRVADAVAAEVFKKELPDQVLGYSASSDVRTGAKESKEGRASVATREYEGPDKSRLRIKITDTSELGSIRASIREQLTMVGNGSNGKQTGALISGHPGIVAYDEARRVSRAVLLLRGRFLLEAMVHDTKQPDAAQKALESLSMTTLAQDDKAGGKAKQP